MPIPLSNVFCLSQSFELNTLMITRPSFLLIHCKIKSAYALNSFYCLESFPISYPIFKQLKAIPMMDNTNPHGISLISVPPNRLIFFLSHLKVWIFYQASYLSVYSFHQCLLQFCLHNSSSKMKLKTTKWLTTLILKRDNHYSYHFPKRATR